MIKILSLLLNKEEKYVFKLLNYNKIVLLNYFIQRVFRQNAGTPYSVHYTSKISNNSEGFKIKGNKDSIIKSLAVSGGCYIGIHEGSTLTIGEGTLWAYGVSIVTGNHELLDRTRYVVKDVKLGRNCWLAKGVTVLPGVTLGDNVTVGANSVVTKSFPSNVVIAGVPAKIIKNLD